MEFLVVWAVLARLVGVGKRPLNPAHMSQTKNPFFIALRCRECGRTYPKEALHVCEHDFGPLEAHYDYEAIARSVSRSQVACRAQNLWRYRELLPIEGEPTSGFSTGFTPLVRADRLARRLGVRELYIKNDAVNHPTLSFKDRVVAVAVTRAKELGLDTIACASTGNLANSVAAQAAASGLRCFVFIPHDLERGKVAGSLVFGARVVAVKGAYDSVNRLCSEIAGKYGWGFVNVNLRAYYAEGSKTLGYEICEQLGWRAPRHTVAPMASGSLLTKIGRAYSEFEKLRWIEPTSPRLHGAQASGCSPITDALRAGKDVVRPVAKPNTIAKSLAIGTPADGYFAINAIRGSGGSAESASDAEIIEGIRLLAECEGIFTETAGGVTVACARRLIQSGAIPRDESIVLAITGNGLKTLEAIDGALGETEAISGNLREFEETVLSAAPVLAATV